MTDRIRIVCEICGKTDEEVNGWHPRCMKHGGPVCSGCCRNCEHSREFAGLYTCTYKTVEQRKKESLQRAKEKQAAENARITDAFMRRRREIARVNAIKRAKETQRKESKGGKNEKVIRPQAEKKACQNEQARRGKSSCKDQ